MVSKVHTILRCGGNEFYYYFRNSKTFTADILFLKYLSFGSELTASKWNISINTHLEQKESQIRSNKGTIRRMRTFEQ